MRKILVLSVMLAFALVSGAAIAQKMHAPKPVWGAMLAGLSDIQSITAALAVFDMQRAATIADSLAKRETFITTLNLPDPVKKGHAAVAEAAMQLAAAAKAGEEQQVAAKNRRRAFGLQRLPLQPTRRRTAQETVARSARSFSG